LDTINNNEFIIALTEHRLFGHILVPFFIQANSNGTFYTVNSQVLKQDIENEPELYTSAQKKLVAIVDKYSDESLTRRFSKKYGSKEFFHNIDDDFFNDHISPFIDKQIIECLSIIKANSIKLFSKPAKYNNVYDEDRISISSEYAKPTFHFHLNDEGLKYFLEIEYKSEPLKIRYKKPIMVTNSPCRMVMNNELIAFETLSAKRLKPFFEKEFMKIPLSVTEKYVKTFVYGIVRDFEVKTRGFNVVEVESEKTAILSLEKGIDLQPILVLKYKYGNKQFLAGTKSDVEVEFKKLAERFVFYKHRRDDVWENTMVDFFKERELKLAGNQLVSKTNIVDVFDHKRYLAVNWVNQYKNELIENGILFEQNYDGQNYYTGKQQLDINVKMEGDWFDMYAVVKFGEFEIPFLRLKRNILNGKREFILPNGEVVILPIEWFVKYKDLLPFAENVDDSLRFSKHHFNILNEKLEGLDEAFQSKVKEFETHSFELLDVPKGVNASLRHYQREGYSWMNTLSKNNFGGCLADDMGLGKTLQTLTLLLSIKAESKKEMITDLSPEAAQLYKASKQGMPASLIIVPTSLVHNWQNEIKKFTPQLKVYKHLGTKRKKIANLNGIIHYYDIIITTYGTIRNDFELLKDIPFNYLILDESQYIKNSGSKTYKAVCALKSNFKLVLTGTPIENSLSDLWSQLNFLNRGLLGSLAFFKKEFIQAIEKKNDEDKQKQLYQLISPFILRRTKEEVAKDLPPLTEQVRYCKMTEEQASLYEEQKSVIRNSILENIEKQGAQKSTFLALQGLTRLRQLANHPALHNYPACDSGKFNEVIRSMENLMAEDHKVLIFSSFVTHLKLFQKEFDERNWEYSLLTGQTRDREGVIKEFQENTKKRVFLISLKAGGVGLNLTSADYIFILDPWWNPASENQAINRAHRIGQDKKVFVYRFITEESIEEKIQHLKERKSALADKFIQSNNPFKSISNEDIIGLFS
jgi:hypothetical protein